MEGRNGRGEGRGAGRGWKWGLGLKWTGHGPPFLDASLTRIADSDR